MRYLLILLILSACGAVKPYYGTNTPVVPGPDSEPDHVVYLVGDAGDLTQDDPLIPIIRNQLSEHDRNSLIFLGDNIYHFGLPEENDEDRQEKEQIIRNQMDIVHGLDGSVFFIPGNHDWSDANENGLAAVRRQEVFVENYLDRGNVYLPDNGCPGPVAVEVSNALTIIFLDSQWWLHKYDVPEENACDFGDKAAVREELFTLLETNRDRNILLIGHHPVLSNGEHGGRFGLKDHIFPLTNVKKYLYLPLPVIGSIYPIARSSGVSRQDTPNKVFNTYFSVIDSAFSFHPRMVYASGHDHNLQYLEDGGIRQIVSGSGSKENYVSKGRNAIFTYQKRGFSRLLYYPEQVWLEFIAMEDGIERIVFRSKIF